MKKLYWVCDQCKHESLAEPPLEDPKSPVEIGDLEPCIHCEEGDAVVVEREEPDAVPDEKPFSLEENWHLMDKRASDPKCKACGCRLIHGLKAPHSCPTDRVGP